MAKTKLCSTCGEEKPLDSFQKTGGRYANGEPTRRNVCYTCGNKGLSEYKRIDRFPKSTFDLELEKLSRIPLGIQSPHLNRPQRGHYDFPKGELL